MLISLATAAGLARQALQVDEVDPEVYIHENLAVFNPATPEVGNGPVMVDRIKLSATPLGSVPEMWPEWLQADEVETVRFE